MDGVKLLKIWRKCINPHWANNGDEMLNQKLVVTTSWDDGSVSDLKLHRLLDKYSLKSTFYITKSYQHIERGLTADEIIELSQKHEIGAHTLTHPDLDKIDPKRAEDEILGSKEYLENLLGIEIKMFCYPRGKFNDEIIKIVEKAGFIGARTCKHGNFNKPNDACKWHITLHASNGSPLTTLKICTSNHLSVKSLIDWGVRAKKLFDIALETGGVYHLWGHSSEIETKNEWDKLEEVFSYISNRDGVRYITNRNVFE